MQELKLHTKEEALAAAREIFTARHAGALFCVAAGSIIGGHGVAFSDLDLTIIYPKIDHAYRESFMHGDLPVEAFVHDVETIQAFIDGDYADSHAPMIHMLATGVALPEGVPAAAKMQKFSAALMAKGPVKEGADKIRLLRYMASDLIDDLRGDRPPEEQRAILYALYQKMGDLYFRYNGGYCYGAKHMARQLKRQAPAFAAELDRIITAAHQRPVTADDVAALEKLMEQVGGYLFDGFMRPASPDKRAPARWLESA